jgi:hypothetical protein
MVNAGELLEVVNADTVNLTNASDSLTFGELYNISWSSRYQMHKRTTTDKKGKLYPNIGVVTIEGDIVITIPEITTFVGYHTLTSGDLPTKNWDLELTGKDTATDTVRLGSAKMSGLAFLAGETGDATFHVTFTSTTDNVSEP